MPFCYQHPDYWHCIAAESKRAGDMVNSRKLFDDSETAHPIEPEEYIPVENIRGKLLLIGAEDDALWDTAKYIRRMEKRLAEKPHECEIETMVYAHGTHFVFPEEMLKIMLPVGSGLFVKWAFHAARKYRRNAGRPGKISKADEPGAGRMERGKVKCVGWEPLWRCGPCLQNRFRRS